MTPSISNARLFVKACIVPSCALLLLLAKVAAQPAGSQQMTEQERKAFQEKKDLAAKAGANLRGEDFPISNDPEVIRVIAAWNSRSQAIKTARVVWTQRRTDKAGSLSHFKTMNLPDGAVVPATDTTQNETRTLLYKDGRVRMDARGQFWRAGNSNLADGEKTEGFDRGRIRSLSISSNGSATEKGGMVYDHDELAYLKSFDALPLAVTLAPFNSELSGFSERGLVRAPELDDTESWCIQVGRQLRYIWVSKSDPAILVRQESRRNDSSIATQVLASWRPSPDGILIPTAWSLTSFDENQRIERAKEFTVESFVLNDEINDAELEVTFPEGTEVFDQTTGILGVADANGVIVPHSHRGASATGKWTGWGAVVLVAACVLLLVRWRVKSAQRA